MKKIWDFIKKYKQYGLLGLLILSAWALIGNTIMYFTPLSGLDKYEGEVFSIKIKTYKCSGSGKYSWTTCAKTEIKLTNSNKVFKLRAKAGQGGLNINVGEKDKVTIYIKNWYQFILTPGTWNGICQFEHEGEILYEYDWVQQNNWFFIIAGSIGCIFSVLFLVIEYYTVKNVMKKKLPDQTL